jgi:citrate synthase
MKTEPNPITTAICHADSTTINVRGRNLRTDLIGERSFTAYFFFLLTGKEPTAEQHFFLDALLVAIAELGLMPSVQAARITLAAAPEAMQGALAAGILGCGSVAVGTSEFAGQMLADGVRRIRAGEGDTDTIAERIVQHARERKQRLPGFGHQTLVPQDPRAERLLELAEERKVAGAHVALVKAISRATDRAARKHLTLNVSGAIPAVMLDLEFPLHSLKTVPLLARTAGILAHLVEERERPIGHHIAHHIENIAGYDGPTLHPQSGSSIARD